MNETIEKQPDIRIWVRLPKNKITLKMQKDMLEWKTQSDFFMHLITTYYNLTKK